MKLSPFFRYLSGAVSLMLLLIIAWMAISGSLDQLPRSKTIGQKVQTIIQLICGLMSLMTVITLFRWKRWGRPIQNTWVASLVITAGLSALVWGPPMPLIVLIFGIAALLFAAGVLWMLRAVVQTEKGEL